MIYDFDQIVERRDTDSIKWTAYPSEVIPLWVADMDFRSADPVVLALSRRVDHGIFGYTHLPKELVHAIQVRVRQLYRWEVSEQEVLFLPGIVTGINVSIQAFTDPGDSVLVQPPVYFHFLRDPVMHGRILRDPPLSRDGDRYEIDFERFESAITDDTKLFVLCNPHNPVGRVYTRAELERIADVCLRHGLIICSDEIHCDLVYPPHRHVPIATLDPEIANRCVTLMSPSKTFNIAGLQCGYAVIRNPELRKRWKECGYGIVPPGNIMGNVAAYAALTQGREWLEQALAYLRENRDYLCQYVRGKMPPIRICSVEATYLAWLDCGSIDLGEGEKPSEFFLKNASVALNDGDEFGKGGSGFVRLNFACPRKILTRALEQMKNALENR